MSTKVVVRAVPPQEMVAPFTKLLPLAVSVKSVLPAVTDAGDRLVSVGVGLLMLKVWPVEVPPPGVGLKTVTVAVPAVVRFAAGMVALRCVESVYVVVRSVPFQRTLDPLT